MRRVHGPSMSINGSTSFPYDLQGFTVLAYIYGIPMVLQWVCSASHLDPLGSPMGFYGFLDKHT